MTTAMIKLTDRALRIVAAGREVGLLRSGATDPKLKAVLNVAAARLVPDVERLTLAWIRDFLLDEGSRATGAGYDRRGSWLRDAGREVGDLYDSYHDWA